MNNATEEIRKIGNTKNYPGFDAPLQFSPVRPKHKALLTKVIMSSHKELRDFISWAKYVRSWNIHMISSFIDNHINDPLPNQHFIFTIGGEIVGMGSLVAAYTPLDAQIALWVAPNYQGKGIGQSIVNTLTYVAFFVWGFQNLYYEHDANNKNSKKLPQKCGFKYSHSRDLEKHAEGESGLWFSWKMQRPAGLPDAILQGRPIEDFSTP